jgi:hypothetical protein
VLTPAAFGDILSAIGTIGIPVVRGLRRANLRAAQLICNADGIVINVRKEQLPTNINE